MNNSADDVDDDETIREYELTVRQQPKQARMCGVGGKDRRPIDPPPIVQLRVIEVNETTDPPQRVEDAEYLENPYYFMFASLAAVDTDEEIHLLKDGKTRCTTGSVVSSLYHLKDQENQGRDAGFFVFPDLSVRTEGSYRLKLSLFEHGSQSVQHCKSIFSKPFYVYTAKKFPGMEESTTLSSSLADQGIKIRIRKDIRVRKRINRDEWDEIEPAEASTSKAAATKSAPRASKRTKRAEEDASPEEKVSRRPPANAPPSITSSSESAPTPGAAAQTSYAYPQPQQQQSWAPPPPPQPYSAGQRATYDPSVSPIESQAYPSATHDARYAATPQSYYPAPPHPYPPGQPQPQQPPAAPPQQPQQPPASQTAPVSPTGRDVREVRYPRVGYAPPPPSSYPTRPVAPAPGPSTATTSPTTPYPPAPQPSRQYAPPPPHPPLQHTHSYAAPKQTAAQAYSAPPLHHSQSYPPPQHQHAPQAAPPPPPPPQTYVSPPPQHQQPHGFAHGPPPSQGYAQAPPPQQRPQYAHSSSLPSQSQSYAPPPSSHPTYSYAPSAPQSTQSYAHAPPPQPQSQGYAQAPPAQHHQYHHQQYAHAPSQAHPQHQQPQPHQPQQSAYPTAPAQRSYPAPEQHARPQPPPVQTGYAQPSQQPYVSPTSERPSGSYHQAPYGHPAGQEVRLPPIYAHQPPGRGGPTSPSTRRGYEEQPPSAGGAPRQ